jgi:hypothetical protein
MKTELISFELSKLSKEKNINMETYIYYNDKGELQDCFNNGHGSFVNNVKLNIFSAYSLNILQKYIREEHKINIEIIGFVSGDEESVCYYYHLRDMTKYETLVNFPNIDENYDIYEECLESALFHCLTLIK